VTRLAKHYLPAARPRPRGSGEAASSASAA